MASISVLLHTLILELGPRNVVLEDLIVRSPNEDSIKLVYADWLQERGNSWGELIALQGVRPFSWSRLFEWDDPGGVHFGITAFSEARRRRESWPNESKSVYESSLGWLRADRPVAAPGSREKALRDQLIFELFEINATEQSPRIRWRYGFADGVFIPQHSLAVPLDDALIRLLEHPVSMAVTELGLGEISSSSNYSELGYDAEIEVLAVLAPPTLRHLVVGAWAEHDISWTSIGPLADLYPSLSALESLELQAGTIDFGDIDLPSLTNLLVRSGGLSLDAIDSLANARCPKLESLTIWFGSEDYNGCESVEVAKPFLEAGQFPQLQTLGLANAEFTDELCELLPKAAILPQLRALDLSLGTMGADGAKALLRSRQRFAHLEQLNLRSNSIPEEMHKELSTLCPTVDLRYQKTRRPYRYVSVAE